MRNASRVQKGLDWLVAQGVQLEVLAEREKEACEP
jgi:hypothetical protein